MTLTIHDILMTSDQTAHTARHTPSRNGWEVSWLPGRTLDRNSAITAMILADLTGEEDLHEGPLPAALALGKFQEIPGKAACVL